jgi:hypothetical protein
LTKCGYPGGLQALLEPLRAFLWRILLESPNPAVANQVCHFLAILVGSKLREQLKEDLDAWQQVLQDEAQRCLEQLRREAVGGGGYGGGGDGGGVGEAAEGAAPAAAEGDSSGDAMGEEAAGLGDDKETGEQMIDSAWHATPAVLAGRSPEEAAAAGERCGRLLRHLALLVEECQVGRANVDFCLTWLLSWVPRSPLEARCGMS